MIRALTSILKSAVPWGADLSRDADPEFREAFAVEDRRERLRIGKLGCVLVIVLMPLGVLLDYEVYPNDVGLFFGLRLLCSALTGVLLALHYTAWGNATSSGLDCRLPCFRPASSR